MRPHLRHLSMRLFHTFRRVSSTESQGAVEESHVTLWGRVTRDNDEAPLETLNDVIVHHAVPLDYTTAHPSGTAWRSRGVRFRVMIVKEREFDIWIAPSADEEKTNKYRWKQIKNPFFVHNIYSDENSSKQSGALMFVRLKGLSCEGSYTRALGFVLLGVITKVAFSKGMI